MAAIHPAEAEFIKQTKAVRPKGQYQMRIENGSRDPICRTQRTGFLVYLSSSQLSPRPILTHDTASAMLLIFRMRRSIGLFGLRQDDVFAR